MVIWFHSCVTKAFKNNHHNFPQPKLMYSFNCCFLCWLFSWSIDCLKSCLVYKMIIVSSSHVFFNPRPKDIQFTAIKEQRKENISLFFLKIMPRLIQVLESETCKFCHFASILQHWINVGDIKTTAAWSAVQKSISSHIINNVLKNPNRQTAGNHSELKVNTGCDWSDCSPVNKQRCTWSTSRKPTTHLITSGDDCVIHYAAVFRS